MPNPENAAGKASGRDAKGSSNGFPPADAAATSDFDGDDDGGSVPKRLSAAFGRAGALKGKAAAVAAAFSVGPAEARSSRRCRSKCSRMSCSSSRRLPPPPTAGFGDMSIPRGRFGFSNFGGCGGGRFLILICCWWNDLGVADADCCFGRNLPLISPSAAGAPLGGGNGGWPYGRTVTAIGGGRTRPPDGREADRWG